MYVTSESYKEAIKSKVISDSISGEIALKDGSKIIITDKNLVSGSLRIIHELCDDYKIGTFNLGVMKIGLHDDSALLRDFSGAEIKISYKIETTSGTETIPMGIFIADGTSVKRRRTTITMTAYDYGILFDSAVSSSVRKMTGTAKELIKAACEKCGVTFGGVDSTLPNSLIKFSPSSSQIQSYRDLVGWCAAILCGYAVIDREGKLKIISSRYKVAADNTTILEDKKLTSAERMSIYSTDTRAWIAEISAYSGDNQKIYKTGISLSDSQAARAIYSLEKNPLLEGKSEDECDEINEEWLYFIDTFMQRGITAEIYGDPSLDVGDVIRCSEGDIDQRKSVVGLITRQEWRYRNLHTIITASAQLSDGFSAEETSDSEESEEETTETISPLKVISQVEKRIDKVNSIAGKGVGVFVNYDKNGERFNDYSETGLAKTAGDWSHAEGYNTEASEKYAHAEGQNTKATSFAAHAEGSGTEATNWSAHSEGANTKASGIYSHAEGQNTIANGNSAHAEGCNTTVEATGNGAHAEGDSSSAKNGAAHAEGYGTTASGYASHAEGYGTAAKGSNGHAEGRETVAGDNAHAEGNATKATGSNAHAEGGTTIASGFSSHAEGGDTLASGYYSHAGGKGTIASAEAQTSIGTYNTEDAEALFLVGCGTSAADRKNALRLDNEGNLHVSGDVTADGSVGDKYLSGDGISINETETAHEYTVNLKPATGTELGGIKVGKGLEIGSDGTLSSTEIYSEGDGITISESKVIGLNIASGSELGGVIVGDGLEIDGSGRLKVTEKEEESGKNYSAGSGITITAGDESDTIAVNVDNDTIVIENGKLKVNPEEEKEFVAGDGVTITEGDNTVEISVNVDNDTIVIENGKLKVNSEEEKEFVAGDGITITEGDSTVEFAVNVDNETIIVEGGILKANLESENGYTAGEGITITEGDESDVIAVAVDNQTIVVKNGKLATNSVSVGNLRIIDHAPTDADITGSEGVVVQVNPGGTPIASGEKTALFSAVAVFAEIIYEAEAEANPPDEAYVCSSAGETIFTMTSSRWGARTYVKSSDGVAYCAYYYSTGSTPWIVPILISETEGAVEHYNTYNASEVLGCEGSFEYNGKTLYYSVGRGATFDSSTTTVSGGRHKLSSNYPLDDGLPAATALAEIIYGAEI